MPEINRYDDSSDIVIRDHNGDPQFQMPQISLPMDVEQNGGGTEEEKEQLLSAVQASLRRKVAALAEDNWMYEAEASRPG
ncbi:MAG: hypothetical protein Q9226_001014 [Calogaya cf. arnoldii]